MPLVIRLTLIGPLEALADARLCFAGPPSNMMVRLPNATRAMTDFLETALPAQLTGLACVSVLPQVQAFLERGGDFRL